MNIIILDLEWNQCPDGKKFADPTLPFEIIEFGAVKLNKSLDVVDTFHEIITPTLYRRLHRMTKSVIALTDQDLAGHRHFPEVARAFFDWCHGQYGQDYLIGIWGTSDLTELQRNLAFHHMDSPFPFPLFYLDMQKIYGIMQGERRSRKSLEYAIDALKIIKKGGFHDAFCDAMYTAQVTQCIPKQLIMENYSVDYYRTPENKRQEIHLEFADYTKDVSRPFSDTEAVFKDRTMVSSVCCVCGRRCRKKIRWFPSGSHNYLSLALCEQHGYLKGKIRVRSRRDGSVYVVKTQRLVNDEEVLALRQKQQIGQIKRKMKAAARK